MILKAICKKRDEYKGLIPDINTYEKLKKGECDWKPNVKSKLKTVEIPYDLFEYLMKVDILSGPVYKCCERCENCIPIGEGDYYCDVTEKIVIDKSEPSDSYMCCKSLSFKERTE